ncbi:ABC transporter permease [Deefgea piscis]|uniref:Transport permease protein n=1 Tax=Deefgea piscis TaxID=2739061 RepID=A0A6M8SM14_9NEIS|nr:ABC transporter permease [Deefgea piscis]QKJ66133.1 ABC transporter permease [Deefgea piscis]
MRSSLEIQYSVIRALFLREAVTRISGGRIAWLWLMVEPISHLLLFILIMGVFLKRAIPGAEPVLFIATGLVGYFMFSRVYSMCKGAISSNLALFSYRQVKAVDTIFARALVECFIFMLSVVLLFAGLALFGFNVLPAYPLQFMLAIFVMWLTGLGLGLLLSVANELTPNISNVIDLLMRPLYFLSAVMYPVSVIPEPYRGYLLYNPLVHGIESIRQGFFPFYRPLPEINLGYLFVFALVFIFFGLILHSRYSQRLMTA